MDSSCMWFQLFNMQDIGKLDSPQSFPSNIGVEHHRPYTSRVDSCIVSKLDGDVFQSVILNPVLMWGHMRSGPHVCIPIKVNIELEGSERVKGVYGTMTCISSACCHLRSDFCFVGLLLLWLWCLVAFLGLLQCIALALAMTRLVTKCAGGWGAVFTARSGCCKDRLCWWSGRVGARSLIDFLSLECCFDLDLVQGQWVRQGDEMEVFGSKDLAS